MKKHIIIVFCFITVVLLTSCVGSPSWEDIEPYMDPNINSNKILNLSMDPNETDIEIITSYGRVMEKNILNTQTEKYGYYYIDYRYSSNWEPKSVGILLPFIGLPTDSMEYNLFVHLFIFDSNGKLIKKIQAEDYVTQNAGLILFFPYGTDPSKKIGKTYSQMLKEIFNYVTNESDAINQALREAGPISREKEVQAKNAILEYYGSLPSKERPDFANASTNQGTSSSSSTTYNTSTPSSSSSSSQDPALDATLDILNTLQDGLDQFDEGMNDFYTNGPYSKCYTCNGTGKCSNCNGTGKLYGANCIVCKGSTSCFACDGDGNIY